LHKVRVEDIAEKGLVFHFLDPKEEWDRYFDDIPRRQFAVAEPLEAMITVRTSGRGVQVEGWFHTVLGLECCRCLEVFSFPLTSEIDVTLFPETDIVQEEEIELVSEDLKASFFSGDEVDLSGLIREQIILNIPFKPLCREDCRGLCPQCGANLNEGDCGCRRDTGFSVFEMLRDLKLQ